MPNLALLLLLCVNLFFLHARLLAQECIIFGEILDETGEPLPNAYVSIVSPEDSLVLTRTVADTSGKFSLTVPAGYSSVVLEARFPGYLAVKETLLIHDCSGRSPIKVRYYLEPKAKLLKEVVVVGHRKWTNIEGTKKIYVLDKNPSLQGASLREALEQIPGVQVSDDGRVLYRGKPVTIYINGRPSPFLTSHSGSTLMQWSAEVVKNIEVVSIPSARHEAQARNAIINIILDRKITHRRISVLLRASYPHEHRLSLQVQYPLRWGSLSFMLTPFYEVDTLKIRHFRIAPGSSLFSKLLERQQHYGINPATFLDIRLSDRLSLTAGAFIHISRHLADGSTSYWLDRTESHTLATRTYDEDKTHNSVEAELSIDWQVPDESKSLIRSWTLKTILNAEQENFLQTISEQTNDSALWEPWSYPHQQVRDYNKDLQMVVTYDMVIQKSKIKVFAGSRVDYRRLLTSLSFFEGTNPEDLVLNPSFLTGTFSYFEGVGAAYLQLVYKLDNLSVELGLRSEAWQIRASALGITSEWKSVDIFPSAGLSLDLDRWKFAVAGSRRIERPNPHILDPFVGIGDRTTQWRGNTFLRPSYIYLIELTGGYESKSFVLTISPFLQYEKDPITRIRWIDTSLNILFATPFNVREELRAGLDWSTQITLFRKLEVYLYGNYSKGTIDMTVIDSAQLSVFGNNIPVDVFKEQVNTSFRMGGTVIYSFGTGISVEMTARFIFPSIWGNIRQKHTAVLLNTALRYSFKKFPLTVIIGGYNLLNEMYFQGVTELTDSYIESYFSRWVPRAYITVSYNWKKKNLQLLHTHDESQMQ